MLSTTIYVYFPETFIKGWDGHALPGDAGLMAAALHANNLCELQIQSIAASIHGIILCKSS